MVPARGRRPRRLDAGGSSGRSAAPAPASSRRTATAEPRRAPLTLTPSLTVFGEYNDNVNLNNDDRRWDFLIGFTPALTLTAESPTYRLSADYSSTGRVFARDFNRSRFFDNHTVVVDGLLRVSPRLTLTGGETFAFTTDTNILPGDEVSSGRTSAWANSVTAARVTSSIR